MKITPEIAELLGAPAGDGFIGNYGRRKQQFMIQFTGHSEYDKKYLEKLSITIRKITPEANIKFRIKENTIRLTTYSKELFNLLKKEFNFPTGKKGNKLSIPRKINKSELLIRRYIRGVFDTDGCLYFDKRKAYSKPYPRIRLEITSQNLFKEIASYLDKHFRVFTCSRKRLGHQRTYTLEIYGHQQLRKWVRIIGFSNEKHTSKL